jgi:iron complex transport system substrate-binding protein
MAGGIRLGAVAPNKPECGMRGLICALIGALALLAPQAAAAPQRIVSMDYCADQYVLALADRAQIAAVSRGALRDDSFYRERASGLARIRDSVEPVIGARPDLIVRTWGGGPDAAAVYGRFAPVLQVGDAATFAAARADLLRAADAIGQQARGSALAADLDARLARLHGARPARAPNVLYLAASGAVAGRGGLINDVITVAGGRNVRETLHWDVLPLERLVTRPPDVVALGFFGSGQTRATPWTLARHPALRRVLSRVTLAPLPTDAISCEAWTAIEAAEQLAAAFAA